MTEIMRDGSGRILAIGTQVTASEGFTTIRVLNEDQLYCLFDVSGSEIKLTFEDYDLAKTIIKAAAQGQLLGFELIPKFAPR